MKRFASIPLVILILFSGISVNIASHYCGGRLVDTRISLSGKLASCGMQDQPTPFSPNGVINRHCCDNILSSFTLGTNYVPPAITTLNHYAPELIHYFLPSGLSVGQDYSVSFLSSIIRPPGLFNPDDVELQAICVFRI